MISATILTKDCQDTLAACLDSLKEIDEVIVLDNHSSDATLEIAMRYQNVKIVTHDFVGFGRLHNIAIEYAKHDWILSIDSDEVLSEGALPKEIDEGAVYSFPRHNYFNGKFIRGGGWYPDRVLRLFNRKRTKFSDAAVHEKVMTEGLKVKYLTQPILHYSYRSMEDFLEKMQTYSTLFAEQNAGKRRSSVAKAIFKSIFTFIRCYFLKRGFIDGAEGYIIAKYNAQTAYYKYLKLVYLNALQKD